MPGKSVLSWPSGHLTESPAHFGGPDLPSHRPYLDSGSKESTCQVTDVLLISPTGTEDQGWACGQKRKACVQKPLQALPGGWGLREAAEMLLSVSQCGKPLAGLMR